MWQQFNRIMDRAAERTVEAVANFLPGLVLLAAILAATIAVAFVVRVLLRRALEGLDVDRRAADAGLVASLGLAPAASVSALIARSVQWMILLVGVLIGLTALDAAVPGQLAMRMFAYLPDVLAALLILIAAMVLSRFLARSVLIGAVNLQLQNERLLAIGINAERARNFVFTQPYITFRSVVVVRDDAPFVPDMTALLGRRFALVRDYNETEIVRGQYPQLDVLLVDTVDTLGSGVPNAIAKSARPTHTAAIGRISRGKYTLVMTRWLATTLLLASVRA